MDGGCNITLFKGGNSDALASKLHHPRIHD